MSPERYWLKLFVAESVIHRNVIMHAGVRKGAEAAEHKEGYSDPLLVGPPHHVQIPNPAELQAG